MPEADDTRAGSGIDLQAALAMAGGDVSLLRELASAFLDEVPRLLESLHSAIEQRNSKSLQTAAHQLQGVMRCLHIDRALRQALELELQSQGTTNWPAAKELMAALEATIASATDALDDFLSEQS